MQNVKCCFCGKELLNRIEWNNPDPLCQLRDSVCCGECNEAYVVPCRRVLWRPWVSNEEYEEILSFMQKCSLDDLQKIAPKTRLILTPLEYKDFLVSMRKQGVVK